MIGEDTHAWRRDLPHMQNVGKTSYLTFVTQEREVLPPPERDVVLATIVRSDRVSFFLHAAVVMPDHVHLLATLYEHAALPKVMQQLKGVSAHAIGRHVWQREYFDRILRSDEDLRRKADYIAQNPVRGGLADSPEQYSWIYRWWIDAPARAPAPH